MIDTAEIGFRSVGQPVARRIARRSAERPGGGLTLLVHGPAGAGKDAFVDDLLALAFCTEGDVSRRPCNACRGCRTGRGRAHTDLVVGSPDNWREARGSGESIVAAARRWLLDAAGAPVEAERRVVLIERADGANEQTQNALLKTLEEPTDRHTFILVADEPSRLLPTIRSRCQPLRIGPVPHDDLVEHLMDRRSLPHDLADALARLAGGMVGTALDYADRKDILEWRRRLQAELLALLERGPADRFGAVADLLDEASRLNAPAALAVSDEEEASTRTPASGQRAAAALIVEAWLSLARDLLVTAAGRPALAPATELGNDVAELGPRVGNAALVQVIAVLERILDGIRDNLAPRLALEAAMLAWPRLAR